MAKITPHFQELGDEHIFPLITSKVKALKEKEPQTSVINLGIGDIALPLSCHVAEAIRAAVMEMSQMETLRGYGPSIGYDFLREKIAKVDYASLGIDAEEIFISDGSISDGAALIDLFASDCLIGIADATYPTYFNSSIIGGRAKNIHWLPCKEENLFLPVPPEKSLDVIYLCSPNNPTGTAMTHETLTAWVRYALKHEAILLFDGAYTAFITSSNVPKSIYAIEGAKEVAIEMRSFSKTAGFTGLRCAYAVLPKQLIGGLNPLWKKRQSIRFNGVSYPIQRGAEAALSSEGQKETRAQITCYLEQARLLKEGLRRLGYQCWGGVDSPYIWWRVPSSFTSWKFFDQLLERCKIVTIPGPGFGPGGEGYVRLSAFTQEQIAKEALQRIELYAPRN